MGIGDIIAQKYDNNSLDLKRSAKMAVLGGFSNGLCLTYWYRFIDKAFYRQKHVIIKKIVADQFIYSPLSILFFLGVTSKQLGSFDEYRKRCDNNFSDIWKADCSVWPAANYINFKYVPLYRQPVFSSMIDVGWNSYICYKTQKK